MRMAAIWEGSFKNTTFGLHFWLLRTMLETELQRSLDQVVEIAVVLVAVLDNADVTSSLKCERRMVKILEP